MDEKKPDWKQRGGTARPSPRTRGAGHITGERAERL